MVVMCHVTWIMDMVVRGPPKRLDGSIPGDSFLTRTSPPSPCMAEPRMARDPATISATFTPSTSDYGHVGGPASSIWLHEDCSSSRGAARLVEDSAEV